VSEGPQELRLAPESIEALAVRLAELLGTAAVDREEGRLLSAAALADLWGVRRRWVYEHAEELGVRRLGGGRRPRLRFDPSEAAARLGRGDAGMYGDVGGDSLSGPLRATFGGQGRSRPGALRGAPRQDAGVGPWER
jgi:hypothetical protein